MDAFRYHLTAWRNTQVHVCYFVYNSMQEAEIFIRQEGKYLPFCFTRDEELAKN